MNGIKLILVIIFHTVIYGSQIDLDRYYTKALDAYKNGDFDLSIKEFESILLSNNESAQLYYNLGNSYYRKGQIGASIWSYENCLKINPGHVDAKYNLELVRLRIKDRVELPKAPIYLDWYLTITKYFITKIWILISVIILFIYSLFYMFSKFKVIEKSNNLGLVFISLFLVSIWFTSHSLWFEKDNFGIIDNAIVHVKSEPNKLSKNLFKVHEGLKVSVKEILVDWHKIELLDGKTGWIEKQSIRLID